MADSEAQLVLRRLEWITSFCLFVDDVTHASRDLTGLNLTQTRILFHTAVYPNKPIGKIASSLCLKASTATAAVTGMEDEGLVIRTPNPSDHRSMTVALTDKGYDLIPRYIDGCNEVFSRLFSFVQEGKREEFLHILLPNGVASMVEDYCEAPLDEAAIYERLRVDPADDPNRALFATVLYIEKISLSLNELSVFESALNLSLNEARILRYLTTCKGDTHLKEIRSNLNIKTNVMSVCLDKLQEAGFINRLTDTSDRRSIIIHLEAKGQSLIKKSTPGFCSLVDSLFPAIAETPLNEVYIDSLFVL